MKFFNKITILNLTKLNKLCYIKGHSHYEHSTLNKISFYFVRQGPFKHRNNFIIDNFQIR